ncbi:MAG TPA: GntR family transcriptional regulator [Noviherbaspirillum sp.]|uniref:GntR family transcriptional regulator n=1 Tax=Noviherbaspirillum sp. TaxID=1926288 RepID=UPI002B48AAF7|nr:GntR family transcriptional regulator [Noviherbaspirillum sp.]HJV84671.1 GntR family transcriptional regulator [Noviherbaspirillum sp.]
MQSPAVLRKPDTLRSYVENYLRESIMEGRFLPGQRLVERELCELLDVSRPSVREALRKLEAEKLIVIVPHRGPMVASISAQEARDLYAIRALMESYAVQEFSRLASNEQVSRLEATVKRLHIEAENPDRRRLLKAKADFYDVILGGCGNALVSEMLLNLLSRISLLRATSFSRHDRLPESLKEIDQLFALIKARNPEGAREAARLHVVNAEKAAMAVLNQEDTAPIAAGK